VTLSSKHLQGRLSPPLDTRSATRALWLVTKYGHMATYGHDRNHPGESQRDQATPLRNICPTTLPVDAGSHRHVHLIDAGIHVQDETVHAPAGLCADKDCETIPLLKWRLDRHVLKTERRAGNGGHRDPHHAMFRRG
jgi:hypothetical protein